MASQTPDFRLAVLLKAARLVLFWEHVWPRLWPLVAVAGVFLGLALLDFFPILPGWLHAMALLGFLALAGMAAYGLASQFRPAGLKHVRHRIEVDSGLHHRPLTALDDRLATGSDDQISASLWQAHLKRIGDATCRLRLKAPSPGLIHRDPLALRAAVFLFLVIAFAAGHGDAAARLERAVLPSFGVGADGPVNLDLWITPPPYTGRAPLFLNNAPLNSADTPIETIKVPAGSALLARADGLSSAPRLEIGGRTLDFKRLDATDNESAGRVTSYRVETTLESGDSLSITTHGRTLAEWRLEIVDDLPPEIVFTAPPARTGRSRLRLQFEANDDYGLTEARVEIRRAGDDTGRAQKTEQISIPLPLPRRKTGPGTDPLRESSLHDLTAHPWAGIPVTIRLVAVDGRGQVGKSGDVTMVLPERIFIHPVARAIIEERKKLVVPTPPVLAEVVKNLAALSLRPQMFFHDIVVFLALRVAQARLVYGTESKRIATVQRLLWDTALRIEDGELSITERDMREAQKKLMEALENNRDKAEIERLMDEFQQTLDRYLEALQKDMESMQFSELPAGSSVEMIQGSELQRMIEEARELARSGSLEAAREMIARLKEILDSLAAGLRPGQPREDILRAQKLMGGLRSLTKRQQQLLDDTFRRLGEQQNQRGSGQESRKGARKGESAEAQNSVRRDLGEVMRQLGDLLGIIDPALGKAERAMRGASGALNKNQLGEAVPLQTEALDQLRQAAEGVAERIARQLGGLPGAGRRGAGNQGTRGRDPFGRRQGGAMGSTVNGSVEIPDQMEMRRSREILHELRRRAGERQRPKVERDYIRRLLRRF